MRICLNRGTTGAGLPLEEFVQIAADAGFDGADVDLGYGEREGTAALADLYAARSLQFGGWGSPVDWRGDPKTATDGLVALAPLARIAGELRIDSCCTWIMPSADRPFIEAMARSDSVLRRFARVVPLESIATAPQ